MVSSEGMEPTKFDPMRKAAETIEVGEGVFRYRRNNGKDFIKRFDDENINVFSQSGVDSMQVKCLTVPSNTEPFGWMQEY